MYHNKKLAFLTWCTSYLCAKRSTAASPLELKHVVYVCMYARLKSNTAAAAAVPVRLARVDMDILRMYIV